MLTVTDNFDLTPHNTFRMKVSCAKYIEYDNADDLASLDFESLPQPVMHIGGGSNLLFTKDFPGTVLHSRAKTLKYVDLGLDEVFMVVGAGVVFDDFVAKACEAGYWGAENLSLIPGEVGAAAVQNIGAYGVEVKDIISGVVCYDTVEKKKVSIKVAECAYGYRDSMFKQPENKGRYIVTSVLFRLTRKYSPKLDYGGLKGAFGEQSPKTPTEVRDAVIAIRNAKLPDPAVLGSAGSFFKNPVIFKAQFAAIAASVGDGKVPFYDLGGGLVKVPAAWMIEQCGFKGRQKGGAAVYEKQPLVIVNMSGNATPEEIISLENEVIAVVKSRFGVELHPEVEHI